MKMVRLILIALALVLIPGSAAAQGYSFTLERLTADIFFHEDGAASIAYAFTFDNDPYAGPIEFVDVGLPDRNFVEDTITADVDGVPVYDITSSGFMSDEPNATGVAVGLGSQSIQPGERGTVNVIVETITRRLREDREDPEYASAVFSPAYFSSDVVHGTTDMTVTFHLPPGVPADAPRWHTAPDGFPSEPETYLDQAGRVVYSWHNPQADPTERYTFGASFPRSYVPEDAVYSETFSESTGISFDSLFGFFFCCGGIGLMGFFIVAAIRSTEKRKLQYLPPKVAIEGHGIKRGLTAVQAALLLEQPMDKILTMILFALIKKGAAEVVTRDPLELKAAAPAPEGLQEYEVEFLEAFAKDKAGRRKGLQALMTGLVKSVAQQMKGFSRKETIAYYRDITERAWQQVEAAETPEVKSAKYDEVMEWTMLDKNYDDRTRDVFRTGPVFIPHWWGRYDPSYGGAGTRPTTTSSGGGASSSSGPSMPTLPGADFAGSIVGGVQNMAAGVVGSLTNFTEGITRTTNPIPVTTTHSTGGGGRGGGSCACACACAGCACACAGGGR